MLGAERFFRVILTLLSGNGYQAKVRARYRSNEPVARSLRPCPKRIPVDPAKRYPNIVRSIPRANLSPALVFGDRNGQVPKRCLR